MLKRFLLIGPLAVYLLGLFTLLTQESRHEPMSLQILAVALASTLCNVVVLAYHYTHPAHPKFLMLPRRRLVLRWHIVSGSAELLAFGLAYATGQPEPAVAAAVLALFVHTPTALYQMSIVFGAKAVMTPGYGFVIALHVFCAAHVLLEPTSPYWLMNAYLALNTYVWVRIFFVLFQKLGLFRESLYSVSIIVSGLVTFPAILGPWAPLALMGFVALYVLLFRSLYRPTGATLRHFLQEHARHGLLDPEEKARWIDRQVTENGRALPRGVSSTDREQAMAVFDAVDQNRDGALDAAEIAGLLSAWRMPDSSIKAFLCRYVVRAPFGFDQFYRHLWRMHLISGRFTRTLQVGRRYLAAEQADFVFDCIDIDGSGYLEVFEVRMLLVEWGLPEREVAEYTAHFDPNQDGRFSREEFRTHYAPIWKFCFQQVQSGRMRA